MNISMLGKGAFPAALVKLSPGETFVSESDAMFRSTPNVTFEATTQSKGGGGGLFGGLKRMFAGENFFLNNYRVTDNHEGEIGLAPTHAGEINLVRLDGSKSWICAGGSYLASSTGIALDTQFQGFKGMFSGEALFFLEAKGTGALLVAAFGQIQRIEVQGELTVDTGHVVAFEDSLQYTVGKAARSWLQSWLSGEGLALHFTGTGGLLVQSHNPTEFGRSLGPLLPPRSN